MNLGLTPKPARASDQEPPLLVVKGLVTTSGYDQDAVRLVDGLDLSVDEGEFVAVVGESGCGKSITCLSIGGLLPSGVHIKAGSIQFAGQQMTSLTKAQIRRFHGRKLAMVFQDPLASLNPTMRIGRQIAEPLVVHRMAKGSAAQGRAEELLDLVGFAEPRRMARAYPHELSGGMRQRVAIAIALACRPRLLIADEPTTALDATVQAQVLELIKKVQREFNIGILFVSHDLRTVARVADKIAVMYAGQVVEMGPTVDVLTYPKHRYTEALLQATPGRVSANATRLQQIKGSVPEPRGIPAGCRFHPRCSFSNKECIDQHPRVTMQGTRRWSCWYPAETSIKPIAGQSDRVLPRRADRSPSTSGIALLEAQEVSKVFKIGSGSVFGRRGSEVVAVDQVSLRIDRNETLGLVGESGSGKSTLGRILVALETLDSGSVHFEGNAIEASGKGQLRQLRKRVQIMFQDSYSSLDRHMRVEQILTEPLEIHRIGSSQERAAAVARMLDRVGLPASFAHRFPRELSGGQRQRVGLARALMLGPKVIVADEPVSSLDVSVQAKILNLMCDLQEADGLSYLFISHDLAVVRYIADRLAVMYRGRIVETGPTEMVYGSPLHPYTRVLLSAADPLSAGAPQAETALDTNVERGTIGCTYRTSCPLATERCARELPMLSQRGPDRMVACHNAVTTPPRVAVADIGAPRPHHGERNHG